MHYHFPPFTRTKEVLKLLDDAYLNIKYMREGINELEDLLIELLREQDDAKTIFIEPLPLT